MKVVVVLFFLLGSTVSLANPQGLSLSEFLKLVKKNDPEFKKIQLDRKRSSYFVDQNLAHKSATISISQEYGFGLGDDGDTSAVSGEIEKEIIESGTTLGLSHTRTRREDREENVSEFRIEQSLYKNFLGRDTRLLKTSLQKQVAVLDLENEEAYEDYLATVLSAYFDYKKSVLDVNLARVAMKEAESLRNLVRQRLQKRVATQEDLDRAELQVVLSEEELLERQRSLKSQEVLIGRMTQTTGVLENQEMSESFSLGKIFSETVFVDQMTPAGQLRKLRISEKQKEVTSSDLLLAQRDDKATFNLVGGYSVDDSERFNAAVNRKEMFVGFEFEMPLGDKQKRAQIDAATLAKAQAQLQGEIDRQAIDSQLRDLTAQLEELRAKVKVSEKKVKLIARIIKSEEREYSFGKVDLDQVISTRSDAVRFRFQNRADTVEFNKVLVRWLAANDQLIQTVERL